MWCNFVFDGIVCSFCIFFSPAKQGVREDLSTIGRDLSTALESLLTTRKDLSTAREDLSSIGKNLSTVLESLLTARKNLSTVLESLLTIRKELRDIRIKQGKRAISLEEVLAAPGMAQRLQHPFTLAETSGVTWAYQNGGDLQEELCQVFEENKTVFDANKRDKQGLQQAIICAGLGMGKSRTLMMVPEMLAAKTEDKTVFTFNVSFENGTPYNKEYESASMCPVLDRICFHLLGLVTDFRQWSDDHRAGFTLDELVERLCKKEQYPTNVVCLLMIDGVHNLAKNELDPASSDKIRVFLRKVMLSCQMTSPYFVFSVCTMTARKTAVDALKGSSVVPCYLRIPSVTTKPETLPATVPDKLFHIVKGFGRAVEVLCDVANKHPERDEPWLLSAVCDQIKLRYSGIVVSVEEQTMLLRYALLKKPLNEDTDLAAHLSMGLMGLLREGGRRTSGFHSSGLLSTPQTAREACSHSTNSRRSSTVAPSSRSCCGIGVSSLSCMTPDQ